MIADYHILTFTDRGEQLGKRLAAVSGHRATVHRVGDLKQTVGPLFVTGNVLVFIGAAGIAVRAIAPLLKSKAYDPAVIVIDEGGRFIVPIISGHIGRANSQARKIASLIGATAVITTATDVNKVFSFDGFAAEHGYLVVNPGMVKSVASAMLEGRTVGLYSDFAIDGGLPGSVELQDSGELGVSISLDQTAEPFKRTLKLMPKCHAVGIGARRGADAGLLEELFYATLSDHTILPETVSTIASIDIKSDEPAIKALAEKLRVEFVTYSAEQLNDVAGDFERSEFVWQTTGTGNVSEAAAYLASDGGALIQPKIARDGLTLAIARKDWRVDFEVDNDRA